MAGWELIGGDRDHGLWRHTTTDCVYIDIYNDSDGTWHVECVYLILTAELQADTFGAAKDAAIKYVRSAALEKAAALIALAIELDDY